MDDIINLYDNIFHRDLKINRRIIKRLFKNNIYIINYLLDVMENKICGFCIHINIFQINAVQIDYIAIDTNYQGMGLAKKLFNHIFDNYCLNKILTLECENHLIGFYKKLDCKLVTIPYESGCKSRLSIMIRHKINEKNILPYERIVNIIKQMNDYSNNKMYQKKVIINTENIKPQRVLTKYLVMNEILPYNNFTKEGIT